MPDPITRSGSNYSIPRDANRVPALLAVSDADGITPLPLEIHQTNGGVNVNVVGSSSTVPTIVLSGKTVVSTAGTRVVLANSTPCVSVTIKALTTNTGTIYVGDSTVAAANGFQLAASDSVSMDISNVSTLYIDSSVNGEGVSWIGVA